MTEPISKTASIDVFREDIRRLDNNRYADRMVLTVYAAKKILAEIDALTQPETRAEPLKPELLVLVMDWVLNDEGWRPEHPEGYWNSKFEKLARAAQAEWDAIEKGAPETPCSEWTAVTDGLPKSGVKVLGHWLNELGKERRTCVEYVAPRTRDAEDIWEDTPDDWFDCDESGTSWVPEGWYERVEGSDEYPYSVIPVTHWRPLPAGPALKASAPHG